jgi:hypothetical protein
MSFGQFVYQALLYSASQLFNEGSRRQVDDLNVNNGRVVKKYIITKQ